MFHSLRWRIFFMVLFFMLLIPITVQLYISTSTQGAFTQYVTSTKECSSCTCLAEPTPPAEPKQSFTPATQGYSTNAHTKLIPLSFDVQAAGPQELSCTCLAELTPPAKQKQSFTPTVQGYDTNENARLIPLSFDVQAAGPQELSCLYALARTNDPTKIQAMIDQAAQRGGEHLIVIDQQQHVLADSAHQFDGRTLDEISTSDLLAPTYGPVVLIVASSENSSPDVGVSQPSANSNTSKPEQKFNNSINLTFFYALILSILLAFLCSLLCSHMIIKPIKALTRAAQAMEQGDLSQRVHIRSKNEIGILAHAFNTMAEAQERFEQLRRNMISDIAHELRTPLTNIRAYLEGIQDQFYKPTPAIIDSLYEESLLLTRLVTDLHELSQAEAGQLHLYRRPMELTEVIHKAVQGLQPGIMEKEIALTLALPDRLPDALIDPERIGQVLRNLLSNAITHTPQRGTISIKASFDTQTILISVEDSGDGIAPEHLPYVFERFYRTDTSRSRATGGSGLGLAIVKQLVQAHGGTTSVSSQMGKGTCFRFSIPTAQSLSNVGV